jgi:hypothetical protein
VRGDTLEMFRHMKKPGVPDFFGDEVERIISLNPVTGEILRIWII